MIKDIEISARFFIIDGAVPILIGNDILEPLGGVIDTEDRNIEFKKLDRSLHLVKTRGGHYVLPLQRKKKDVAQTDDDEVNEELSGENETFLDSDESDAVVLLSLAECETDQAVWRLHDVLGHRSFLTALLSNDEEKEIMKVHRYFGHRSGRKIWELFAKSGRLNDKKKAVLDLLDRCKSCKLMKKTPPRPRVGLPVANTFNEIVGLDLKIFSTGQHILWMVDHFTKVIKGKVISDKRPDTIVSAIIEKWIVGDGFGPGHPSKFFYSDNGGEFLNNDLINFAASQDTIIKMTAANSPWQNGIVERHHATADVIFEKLSLENPNMSAQEIVDKAAMAKNSEVGRSGFSPLQLVMGQNPSFPGFGQVTKASSNLDHSSKFLRALRDIDDVRVQYRKFDCDEKLKKVRSQKINPCVERSFEIGDPVLFKDFKRKEWKQGTVLVRFGKTLYLKFGNWLRRVPIDAVMPDVDMANKIEDGFIVPEEVDIEDETRFQEEEVQVEDLEKDLEAEEVTRELKNKIEVLQEEVKKLTEEKNDKSDVVEFANGVLDVKKSKLEKKKAQKAKMTAASKLYPVLGQMVQFKENGSENWTVGRVFRVFKKASIHRNVKQLILEDGSRIERNFETEIEEWKPFTYDENLSDDAVTEGFLLTEIINGRSNSYNTHDWSIDNFVVGNEEETNNTYKVQVLKKDELNDRLVQDAMLQEIDKYKKFDAIEEVSDFGQKAVPIRWVITRQEESNGKNQPLKARICIRGDLENNKDSVRSDSPSAGKETLKLALMIASNEKFSVKGADIKSAYLQGQELKRTIFVKPPPEANAEGKLWRLKKAAYGVLDGGRLFYLRLVEELTKLGLHKVHSDGALFTYVRDGVFHGLVASVVDSR